MNLPVISYDIAVVHDGTPAAQSFASWLSSKLRTFSFCLALPAGGLFFLPPGEMAPGNEAFMHAIRNTRHMVVIHHADTQKALTDPLCIAYRDSTGKEPIHITCDRERKVRRAFCTRYPVAFSASGIRGGCFSLSQLAQLKAALTGQAWTRERQRRQWLKAMVYRLFIPLLLVAILLSGYTMLQEIRRDARIQTLVPMNQFKVTRVYGWSYFNEDGTLYADLQVDGTLLVRSTADNTILQIIQTDFLDLPAVDFVFSPDSRLLLVYNRDATVLYNLESGNVAHVFPPCSQAYLRGSFVANGQKLALAEYDSNACIKVSLWETQSFTAQFQMENAEGGTGFVGFTRDGAYMVGKQENRFLIRVTDKTAIEGDEVYPLLSGNTDLPEFSPNGKYVVETWDNQIDRDMTVETSVQVKSCQDGRLVSSFKIRDFGYPNIYFDTNNRLVVSKPRYLAIYDPLTGACSSKASATDKPYHQYATMLIPDSRFAVTALTDFPTQPNDKLAVFDTRNGHVVARTDVDGVVERIQVYPGSRIVLALTGTGNVHFFTYENNDTGVTFGNGGTTHE